MGVEKDYVELVQNLIQSPLFLGDQVLPKDIAPFPTLAFHLGKPLWDAAWH